MLYRHNAAIRYSEDLKKKYWAKGGRQSYRGHVPYQGGGSSLPLIEKRKKYLVCPWFFKIFIKIIFLYCDPYLSTGSKEIFVKKKERNKLDFFSFFGPLIGLRVGGGGQSLGDMFLKKAFLLQPSLTYIILVHREPHEHLKDQITVI